MQTLTEEEFRQKYGVMGELQFQKPKREEGVFQSLKDDISNAFQGGVSKVGQAINESRAGRNPLETGLKAGAGLIETAFSPLAPVTKPLSKGIEYAGENISKVIPLLDMKDIEESPGGDEAAAGTGRILEGITNAAELVGGAMGGPMGVKSGIKGAGSLAAKTGEMAETGLSRMPKIKTPEILKGAVRDIIPTKANLIDENVAKALEFTPGDLANIETPVGQFLAENNLIGTNRATTENLINAFFKKNYEGVRSEIAKVPTVYKASQIPRFVDALKQIQGKVEGVAGMETVAAEIDNLLNIKKNSLKLEDVQRVKELIDDHFRLYNQAGDVASGIEKQGLATIRKDLRKFIEDEVKKNTGTDIGLLNRNVSTSKEIVEAIKNRAPKGVTKSMLSVRDTMIGVGLFAGVNPLAGLAYTFVAKLASSPTARLRFARWLDELSDSQKKAVNSQLLEGNVPKDALEATGLKKADLSPESSVPLDKGEIPPTMETQTLTRTRREGVSAQKADTSGPFEGQKPALTYKNFQENEYSIDALGADFDEPIKFYRSGSVGKGDIFLTDNEAGAIQYGGRSGKVDSFYVNAKNPLVIDAAGGKLKDGNVRIEDILTSDLKREFDETGMTNNPRIKQAIIEYAKKNGYDAAYFPDSFPDGEGGLRSLVVWDKSLLSKKAPDLSSPSIPKELEPLAAEARKYKSAEEFVKAHQQSHLMDLSNYEAHRFGRALPDADFGRNESIANFLSGKSELGSLETLKYDNPEVYKIVTSPSDVVTIYRAAPKNTKGIQVGDYVALTKRYAEMHLRSVLEGEQKTAGKIFEIKVPKTDVIWHTNDYNEWVYSPQKLRDQYSELTDFYNKVMKVKPSPQ